MENHDNYIWLTVFLNGGHTSQKSRPIYGKEDQNCQNEKLLETVHNSVGSSQNKRINSKKTKF